MRMPRRRNNRERQDISHNERKSSVLTMVSSAILGAIFGIIGGLSSDYLKTYFHFLDILDIHAYMLILSPYKNSYNLQLVFVNSGNRQGVISELDVGYSINKFGVQGYMPFRPPYK
jgi:hypothetical protein